MSGYRGYVASRPVRGEFTPQHVQNLVIRDYAARHQLTYLLSATEYSMQGCFMMLESALEQLESTDGLIMFTLFMLPGKPQERRRIYERVLQLGRTLHFALENLSFSSAAEIDRLEDIFRVEMAALSTLDADRFEPSRWCPLCGGPPARIAQLSCAGVTSDEKPWPRIAPLIVCATCRVVHKETAVQWWQDTAAIYADYSAYHQAGGVERKVPSNEGAGERAGSALSPRSSLLARFAGRRHSLAHGGRVLDVGCGNGAFLRAFAAQHPDWELVGVDRSESGADSVRAIGATFALGDVTDEALASGGDFDLISLVHVLEHVPAPIDWLSHLAAMLRPGGAILVDLPDHETNPFDLAVVDHVVHFNRDALYQVASRAGLAVIAFENELIAKEHVALLAPSAADPMSPTSSPEPDLWYLDRLAGWLKDELAPKSLGVLGTGIAATWAAGVLGARVAFFVDEDPARREQPYLGVPVIAAADVARDSTVFVAQPPQLSLEIAERLRASAGGVWVPCPALTGDD